MFAGGGQNYSYAPGGERTNCLNVRSLAVTQMCVTTFAEVVCIQPCILDPLLEETALYCTGVYFRASGEGVNALVVASSSKFEHHQEDFLCELCRLLIILSSCLTEVWGQVKECLETVETLWTYV